MVTLSSASITIGDFVWCDTNGDCIQDLEEPGIFKIAIKIYNTIGPFKRRSAVTSPFVKAGIMTSFTRW